MQFTIESSPHFRASDSVPKIMGRVIIALIPAIIYSILLHGARVLVLYVVAIASCVIFEIAAKMLRKRPHHVEDLSAVLTAILLVMTLPSTATIPMIIIGSGVAIIFAKEVFGGLGFNIFNPALVGRAFLAVAFPAQASIYPALKNIPFGISSADIGPDSVTTATGKIIDLANALTQSTPLSFIKNTYSGMIPLNLGEQVVLESKYYFQMFIGNTSGTIGETSFLLLLIGGIFLILTKTINWRIPVGITIALIIVNTIGILANPGTYATPLYQILGGGFILGAVYMATDMVSSPSSPKCVWIYSILIGATVMLLRMFGSSNEYMMYAILIGNMFVPLITILVRPKPLGKVESEVLLRLQKNEGESK